jgi:hypothetical protein
MEFVDEIPEEQESKRVENSLEIGLIKFKNGPVNFEIKDVKVKDVEGLREFIEELLQEWER